MPTQEYILTVIWSANTSVSFALVACGCNKSNYDFCCIILSVDAVVTRISSSRTNWGFYQKWVGVVFRVGTFEFHPQFCVNLIFRSFSVRVFLTVMRNANIFITAILCTHHIPFDCLFASSSRILRLRVRNSACLWWRHRQSRAHISRTQHYNHYLHRAVRSC